MKMTKNYLVYLLQEYTPIKIDKILQFIINETIVDNYHITHKEENKIVISFQNMEEEEFVSLSKRIESEFNYNIIEFSLDCHKHIHIEIINDEYEIVHAFTVYLTDTDRWEVYYSEGIFLENLQPTKGNINEEIYFLFSINTTVENDLEDYFTSICEKWVIEKINK